VSTRNIRCQIGREYIVELLSNMHEKPSYAREKAYDAAESAWLFLVKDGEIPSPSQISRCVTAYTSSDKHKKAVVAYMEEAFT
jgi:hypothetical protein